MAKTIKCYEAKLLEATPVSNHIQDDWSWRLQYVGMAGSLAILESEYKHPGEVFLHLNGVDGRCLKTSCGTLEDRGDTITFTTKQSVYIFEVIT